jgi:hypothetical protein
MKISGVEIHIESASFADAMALQKALGRALKGQKLDLSGASSDIIKKDAQGNIDVASTDLSGAGGIATTVFNLLLGPACSDEVESCAMACAKKCYTADTEKLPIDPTFFEKVDNRGLYYPIMIEVIKANCGPFIKGLVSSFGDLGAILGKGLTQK